MMKIFISLKVPRGDATREAMITALSDSIHAAGHVPFVATQEIARAGLTAPAEFMPFVRAHLAETDLFIVVYHPELRGGLIEAGIAYERGIPIWVCHKPEEKVSSSLLGCAERMVVYQRVEDLQEEVIRLLRKPR